jgi:hypothetical protein
VNQHELDQVFPLDDFIHWDGMECPCVPEVKSLPELGIQPMIVHRRISVQFMLDEQPVPDTVPENWG